MSDYSAVPAQLQSIIGYFDRSIKTRKTPEGRDQSRQMKILALEGIQACYSCALEDVGNEEQKTNREMETRHIFPVEE
jgi:hypothetical protein